jgi:chemotaxis protein CheY-P-specific phosphatase CheC
VSGEKKMDKKIFISKIRELANIISGRFSVHINDFFGNVTDIDVPDEKVFVMGQDIHSQFKCNAYIFYTEFFLDGRDVSIILYIREESMKCLTEDSYSFFNEIGDDIKFIISEIVQIFAESDDLCLEKFSFNREFLESIFNSEVSKRTKDKDDFNFIFNNIFLKKDKKDFGGILVFF